MLTDALAATGRTILRLGTAAVGMYAIFVRTLYYVVRGKRERGATLRQMHALGNRSVFLLTVVMGFIGMIMVLQSGLQTKRIMPDLSMLGPSFLELFVRDLGATFTALLLATRVGAGIAAEIGSMVVTEQVDALRMCAADPVDYLVKPRFLASIVMTVALTIVATAVAMATGAVTAWVVFDVRWQVFFDFSLVHAADVGQGLAKAVAYGAAIPTISGFCGLSAFGGSEGVGAATTRAVVSSSLAVIVIDFTLSAVGYLAFG